MTGGMTPVSGHPWSEPVDVESRVGVLISDEEFGELDGLKQ